MANAHFDGIEIEQMLMDSLDIAERYGFSDGKYDNLPMYEKREKIIDDLYKIYTHILVTTEDDVFGLRDGKYVLIKKAEGLYKDVQNAGKI